MFPQENETKINSKDILNKLNEGNYTFSISKSLEMRKEIFKLNRETLFNINKHSKLIARFDDQHFNIVLNKEFNQDKLISVILQKTSNNTKISLKCTFNSGNIL